MNKFDLRLFSVLKSVALAGLVQTPNLLIFVIATCFFFVDLYLLVVVISD